MAYDAVFWREELDRYKKDYERFVTAGHKILKRYRDERKDTENTDARFNVFWSNVKTLKPAIYSRPPKVEVSRRFKDQNDVGRTAAIILERVIDYELRQYSDYHDAMSHSVDDRLLPGRGVAWVRYEPKIEAAEQPQISDDAETGEYETGEYDAESNGLAGEQPEPLERVTDERTPVDYVYWEDFAHLPSRTWDEVTWVARRVYMGKEEGLERFGDIFNEVPLTHSPDKKDDDDKLSTSILKKGVIWEIWCKSSRKVYWIAENFDKLLDGKDDPLKLECFFPCPKPIFATVTTNSLIPVADFKMYQDQADEIDDITGRIQHLTRALKVMGIYAADEPALTRLMKEGNDAVMVPVTNWPAFMEKGGLQNSIQFMPLGDVIAALQQLYAARESCKQVIYEVTGISDILRGASVASETATAQQIKSQFASIRLNDMKDDVARFARDLLRLKAEIICSKYQPEIILTVSGIANTPDAQFAPQAIALLKNEPLRNFMIDIQTDTLVELDEQGEKQSRVEFLTATGSFLEKAVQASTMAPDIVPLLMQMLLFGIRGFKAGREMEGVFEQASQQIQAKMQQAQGQPKPPSPDQMKAQLEQSKMQAQMQMEQQKAQMAMQSEQATQQLEQQKAQLALQTEQAKMQLEQMKAQQQIQIEQAKLEAEREIEILRIEHEKYKAQLDAETKVLVAQIGAASKPEPVAETETEQPEAPDVGGALTAALQGFQMALENMKAPRTVVRDVNGKIVGVQ